MGTKCLVIDSLNSNIKVGTVFNSKRDVVRALQKLPVGSKVGLDMEGRKCQFRRTGSMVFIEALGKVVGEPTVHSPDGNIARSSRRPGRTAWKVENPLTSGLTNGKIFTSRTALITAAKIGSEVVASDVTTGIRYHYSINASTYSWKVLGQ